MFKAATLVYKYLHTGFPRYFAPYLSSYSSSYSTRRSQSGGNFLVIPKFCPSVHKSVKQFGNSFAFDAPTVWNALPDEIRASPSLASFRKQLKTYLYTKAYPPWSGSFPWRSPWCLTLLMSLDTEILLTAFCLLRFRVLLFGEIKRYKSPIRIGNLQLWPRFNQMDPNFLQKCIKLYNKLWNNGSVFSSWKRCKAGRSIITLPLYHLYRIISYSSKIQ